MIRQCAWCKVILGETKPLADKSISHGMCAKCEKKVMKEFRKSKGD